MHAQGATSTCQRRGRNRATGRSVVASAVAFVLAVHLLACSDGLGQVLQTDLEGTGSGGGDPFLLYGFALVGLIDHPCRARMSVPPNPAYAPSWISFSIDNFTRPNVRLLLRGDSTLAYSGRTPGWTDGHNRAVAGNTACDAIQQLPAVPAQAPQAVLIGTYGGNDLLYGHSVETTVANTKDLIDQTRARWPEARIVGVGIHPSRVLSLGDAPCSVNTSVRAYLSTLDNTCDIDPFPIFGKACGELSDPEQMLPDDLIHYNTAMGARIKTAVREQCDVLLSLD